MTIDATKTMARSFKNGELKALQCLVAELGFDGLFKGDAVIFGADPILGSPHKLSEATSCAVLMEAIAAASIWTHRNAESYSMQVDVKDAIHSLHSTHFLWQSGYKISVGAEYVFTNGMYRCKDGRYLMIESGPPYPKLESGYLNFFDCGNNRNSLARCIAQFNSEDLQEQLSKIGLPACIAYTPEEWLKHPQGSRLARTPLVEIVKIAEGKPMGLSAQAKHPLAGIKALDFTHVLAGPRSMRTLASYGAEVLHISSPYHRDTISQNLLVNAGKRNAYLDLSQTENLAVMQKLASEADVFSFSYRPAVAERFDLTPFQLSKNHPGIVCLSINCYGHDGPWAQRPGFDQNAQVATGFAWTERNQNDVPQFSPVFYLNDLLTAYLAAAGVMSALHRRATEGGSYHVKLSLARTAMWVQGLGLLDKSAYGSLPASDNYPPELQDVESPFGIITELVPPVKLSRETHAKSLPVKPFGSDKACWS